jgi:hypothetical protein
VLRPHAGEDASHVVVLTTVGAPQRRFLGRRRARAVEAQPGVAPVPVTRATVIDAVALNDESTADRWLDDVDADALVDETLRALNRVIGAYRIAAAQDGARDAGRPQALAVRVGWGAGEEVADGRHSAARNLPAQRDHGGRTAALRTQERLGALLTGRDVMLAAEHLALRARTDLAARRTREAALQLRVALEAALTELGPWADRGDLQARIDELRATRSEVGTVANRALEGGLDTDEEAVVERVLARLEAALRARTAAGID